MSVYIYRSSKNIPLESCVRAGATAHPEGRERQMKVLYEAMKVLVQFLQKCRLRKSPVKTEELVERKSVPLKAS